MTALFFIAAFLLLALSLRYNWWRIPVAYHVPRVLMYHMIKEHGTDRKRNKWRVKPNDFEKQMSWLAKNGWRSFTISELVRMNKFPNKSVCITFDDGFEDNLNNALPVLKQYGFKATVYLVPDSKENNWEAFDSRDFDKLLSRDQIKEMQNSGLIEFGSHTVSHCNLTKVSQADAKSEIKWSKKEVEELTGLPCYAFAYPYGRFDEMHVELVKQAGYTSATTVKRGFYQNTSSYKINRLGILGTESFFDFYLKFTRGRNKL